MNKVNPELSNELFLNTPERILENIKVKQKEILEANKFIAGLKIELEDEIAKANKLFAEKKEYEQQEDIAKKEPTESIWIVK